MKVRKKVNRWIYVSVLLSLGLIYFLISSKPSVSGAAGDISEKYFKGAKIKEIYRMRLDPGDLLLESIQEFIDRERASRMVQLSPESGR